MVLWRAVALWRAVQKWTYSALPIKILAVLASSMPLVLLFGTVYYLAGGTPRWWDALLKVHLIIVSGRAGACTMTVMEGLWRAGLLRPSIDRCRSRVLVPDQMLLLCRRVWQDACVPRAAD